MAPNFQHLWWTWRGPSGPPPKKTLHPPNSIFCMHLLHAHAHLRAHVHMWPPKKYIFQYVPLTRMHCTCTTCAQKICKKSKLYYNTFHLPPSGPLCDHLELSYWYVAFVQIKMQKIKTILQYLSFSTLDCSALENG